MNMVNLIETKQEAEDLRHGLYYVINYLDETGGPNDKKLADRLQKIKDKLDNIIHLRYPFTYKKSSNTGTRKEK